MGDLTLPSCFRGWLEEFRGEGGWPRPRAPWLPSRGLFWLCESPWASWCRTGARTLMGLGARAVATAGTPPSWGMAAATEDLPPCWVIFRDVSLVLGAMDLPRGGVTRVFPGVLPHGALRTPTLSRVPGARREGVGARHIAPRPRELGRAGDPDGGGCLPKTAAGGSHVLQGERAEKGPGAAASPLHPAGCWAPP